MLPERPLLDIGDQAIWKLSSFKQGFGVEKLRDDSVETYWQSDGSQPHWVTLQFPKRTDICVCIELFI